MTFAFRIYLKSDLILRSLALWIFGKWAHGKYKSHQFNISFGRMVCVCGHWWRQNIHNAYLLGYFFVFSCHKYAMLTVPKMESLIWRGKRTSKKKYKNRSGKSSVRETCARTNPKLYFFSTDFCTSFLLQFLYFS